MKNTKPVVLKSKRARIGTTLRILVLLMILLTFLSGCDSSSSHEKDGGGDSRIEDDDGSSGTGGDLDTDTDSDMDTDSDGDSDTDNDTDGDTDAGADAGPCEDASPPECVRYVDTDAPQGGDGLSWSRAFREVQQGIDSAYEETEDGGMSMCEVWVAEGTYMIYKTSPKDTVQLMPHVELYGGFKGNELLRCQRDWDANETILSGCEKILDPDAICEGGDGYCGSGYCNKDYKQICHVVTGSDDSVLDGFGIRGGCSEFCDEEIYEGAGIVNISSSPILANIFFSDIGGVIGNYGSSPRIISCEFYCNTMAGTIIYNESSKIIVQDSVFRRNSGQYGGAIHLDPDSSAEIYNSIFLHNSAIQGGAIYSDSDENNIKISNSVFACNKAYGLRPPPPTGGPYIKDPLGNDIYGCASIYNSIFEDILTIVSPYSIENTCGDDFLMQNSRHPEYSDFPGSGNIDDDPLFIEEDINYVCIYLDVFSFDLSGFNLKPESPCIDTADDDMAPPRDIEGKKRIDIPGQGETGVKADMGAYEYHP